MAEKQQGGEDSESAHGPDDAVSNSELDTTPEVLELDEAFTALAHPRRRYLLYTLLCEDAGVTLPTLATRIAAWENGKPPDGVTDAERTEVAVSLHHAHIPKLADLDVVDYDSATDRVMPATNAAQVQTVLDGVGREHDQQQEAHTRTMESDDLDAEQ